MFIMDLFKIFIETLDAAGVFANEGKMVHARWTNLPAGKAGNQDKTPPDRTGRDASTLSEIL